MGIFGKKKTQDPVTPGAVPAPSDATVTDATVMSASPVVDSSVPAQPTTSDVSGDAVGVVDTSATTVPTGATIQESVVLAEVTSPDLSTPSAVTDDSATLEPTAVGQTGATVPTTSETSIPSMTMQDVGAAAPATETSTPTVVVEEPVQSVGESTEPVAGGGLGQVPAPTTTQSSGVSGSDEGGSLGESGAGTNTGTVSGQ